MAIIVDAQPAGPTTEAHIATLEAAIGYRLSDEYRSFLLEHNGGRPEPDGFVFELDGRDEFDTVLCFFPMRDMALGSIEVETLDELRTWPLHCAWRDLQSDFAHLYEHRPDVPFLPIGTDGSSNYLGLVLEGPDIGSILFFEHEMGETSTLAPSFPAFLASLQPSPDSA